MPSLALILCVVGLVSSASPEPASGTEPEVLPPVAEDQDLDATTPIVVLLVGAGREGTADASAIAAHLHGLDVAVHTRAGAPQDADAREQYRVATRIAAEEGARAVIWVERDETRGYTLHAVREGERAVHVRTVERDPSAASAGLEALGIVTRSIAGALVSDAPLEMDVVEVPPEAPPRPDPDSDPDPRPASTRSPTPSARPDARGRALLAVGWVGTSYARQVPWQSGVAMQAAWGWPFGLHVGVGYAAMQRVRAASPIGSLEVRRHPAELLVGWHWPIRNLWIGAEGVVVVDASSRSARGDEPGTVARPDRVLVSTAIAPRVRISLVAVWRLEVFATLAMEAWLSGVRHAVATESGEVRELLTPRRIRATTAVGVAVRL